MTVLDQKLIDLLNYRINQEELSSRIYLSMSVYLQDVGYVGAAKLWSKYAEEELKHADWARDFLLALDIQPETQPIGEVPQTFTGLPDIINRTLDHELEVTRQCQELAKAALSAMEFMVFGLAQKYVNEQVEELEKSFDLVNRLKLFGEDKVSLRMFDEELGEKA